MKKIASLLTLCIVISFTTTMSPVYGQEEGKDTTQLIDSFEKDMNGDGFQEYIRLQGDVLNNDNGFFQDVWLSVQNKLNKEWSISLQHGYQPEANLVDLTGDKNPDIFYQVAKDEESEHFHYQLYRFNQNKVQAIDLPSHEHTQAKFTDDFKLELSVNPAKKPTTIDLADKKDTYIENGVYKEDGAPLEENEPTIDQHGVMEPVIISDSKGYGLKTSHHIHGMDEKDILGKLETIWHFEKNKWINIKTEVVPE